MKNVRFLFSSSLLFACLVLVGCSSTAERTSPGTSSQSGSYTPIDKSAPATSVAPAATIDEAQVLAAQNDHATHVQVTCTLPVKRMLRPDEKGEKHEKFLLHLSNDTSILVAHNISRAASVPLNAGDIVTVHGEYIWNAKGGVIHWTHRSDSPRHESGYIDFNGARYQ